MTIALPTAVYTADHGYAWVSEPSALEESIREQLLADALSMRTDFPEDDTVDSGVVVRHGLAAVFTIRRVKAWDAEGRDADYAAFVFVPSGDASKIDFGTLLAHSFFAVPTRTPPAALTYDGPASEAFPITAAGHLLCNNRLEHFPASAIGSLLAQYATKADRWLFVAECDHRGATRPAGETTGSFTITTSPWHR